MPRTFVLLKYQICDESASIPRSVPVNLSFKEVAPKALLDCRKTGDLEVEFSLPDLKFMPLVDGTEASDAAVSV